MKYRLRLLIVSLCVVFVQQGMVAQENTNNKYLSVVGTLDSIYSDVLNETRDIYIQIPSSYSPEKNQKYPVVFILDGDMLLPTLVDVHNYYSGGFLPEMVLVGISNDENRTRDLTTSTIKTKFGMPFNTENGEADNFSSFIEKELIPFIEKKYPVTNFRTLIGHSYGGLFTIHTLINKPNLFTNYLAIDPSMDWDNQKLLKEAEVVFANQTYENKSLFVSLSGQLHMQDPKVTIDNVMQDTTDFTLFSRSNITFSNLARKTADNGLIFDWKFYPKELHGTIPLPSIMDGLISLFDWFQMEDTYKINAFDTSIEELVSIIEHRAQKLYDHFGYTVPPYPEGLLVMSGYMSMDMGKLEKAKMYFEKAIEYYPNNVDAYNSMADYYEAQGDFDKAIKFVIKAFELSGSDDDKKRIDELKEKKN